MQTKWIQGFEGMYAVTDDGRVASYTCNNAAGGKPIWFKLTWHGPKRHQYLAVTLSKDGKCKIYKVHQLVLETFVSPRPQGMLACHKDDNPSNNNIDNLYWGTRSENYKDWKHNRVPGLSD